MIINPLQEAHQLGLMSEITEKTEYYANNQKSNKNGPQAKKFQRIELDSELLLYHT